MVSVTDGSTAIRLLVTLGPSFTELQAVHHVSFLEDLTEDLTEGEHSPLELA